MKKCGCLGVTGTVVPLVETVDGDDARSLGEGVAKGGLLGDGLAAGVEESIADLRVLGPTRDQSPAVAVHETLLVALGDGEERSLRPEVPAGQDVGIEARGQGGVEQPGQSNRRGEEGDASTHGSILPGKMAHWRV